MSKLKAAIAGEVLEQLLAETGNVKCERCTTKSDDGKMTWAVWHTPEHPCPHADAKEPNKENA